MMYGGLNYPPTSGQRRPVPTAHTSSGGLVRNPGHQSKAEKKMRPFSRAVVANAVATLNDVCCFVVVPARVFTVVLVAETYCSHSKGGTLEKSFPLRGVGWNAECEAGGVLVLGA